MDIEDKIEILQKWLITLNALINGNSDQSQNIIGIYEDRHSQVQTPTLAPHKAISNLVTFENQLGNISRSNTDKKQEGITSLVKEVLEFSLELASLYRRAINKGLTELDNELKSKNQETFSGFRAQVLSIRKSIEELSSINEHIALYYERIADKKEKELKELKDISKSPVSEKRFFRKTYQAKSRLFLRIKQACITENPTKIDKCLRIIANFFCVGICDKLQNLDTKIKNSTKIKEVYNGNHIFFFTNCNKLNERIERQEEQGCHSHRALLREKNQQLSQHTYR